MAKKKAAAQSSSVIRERNRKIWGSVPVDQWSGFFRTNDPEKKEWKLKATALWTNCRTGTHEDKTPSMVINPGKGFAKCFACEHYEHDPVKVVAMVLKKTVPEAVKILQTDLGIKILSPAETKALEHEYSHVDMKNKLALVLKECLHYSHMAWLARDTTPMAGSEWYFAENTIEWLENRKILNESYKLPIGLLPNEPVFKRVAKELKISDEKISEMLAYLKKVMEPLYIGTLVFIYHSSPTNVSRFRLRRVKAVDSKGIISIDDPYEDNLGIFGLGMYNVLLDREEGIGNTTKCIMVEGEVDQMQYAHRQIEKANFDWICVAHSGGANHNIGEIRNYGIKNIYYMPDDDEGGCNNARDIMASNHGFDFRIFNWPDSIKVNGPSGTDPDLALVTYGFDVVSKEINDTEHNWVKPEYWCKEQVKKAVRLKGIEDDQIAISRQVMSYAPCVGSKDENQATVVKKWTKEILQEFGITSEEADKMANDLMAKDSDEQVFINAVKDKLSVAFDFLVLEADVSSTPIKAWCRRRRQIVEFRLGSEAQIKGSLASSLGMLVDWCKKELYLPDFIKFAVSPKGEIEEVSIATQEERLLKYMFLTLKSISSELPTASKMEKYASGVHWLYANPNTGDNKKALFIINGTRIYKVSFDENEEPVYEELNSPKYGPYIFDTTQPPWSQELKSLDDLKNFPKVSLKDLILTTKEMIDLGWTFLDNETESMALGTFCAASTILKIFPQNLQWLASNERGCGKTALVADFIGGGKGGGVNVVEHSHFVDNTTPAGLRQSMDGSSLILIMDEFDNVRAGKFRGEKNEEVMAILRCSSSGTGIYQQGSQQGEPKQFRLSFSSIVAGIDPDVSDANMTRFLTVDLKSGMDQHLPPKVLILRKWSPDDIKKHRRSISLGVLRYVPKLLRSFNYITGFFADMQDKQKLSVLQRQLDSMIILMSIMHAADLDWMGWFKRTCEVKSQAISKMSKMTSNEALFSTMILTSNIEVMSLDVRVKKNLSKFMAEANDPVAVRSLNESGCGASLHKESFTDGDKWYLLVVWQTAIYNLLRGTKMARNKEDPYSLKTIAERHPLCLPDEQASVILDRLPEVDHGTKESCYSLFDVTSKVLGESKRRTDLLKALQTPTAVIKTDIMEAPANTAQH